MVGTEARDGLLTVHCRKDGDVQTLALVGELDMANVQTLAAQVEACEAAGEGTIVIDLSALEFVDSSGIALLVAAHHRLNDGGAKRLRLIPSRALAITRVMETTGLDAVLPFADRDGVGAA